MTGRAPVETIAALATPPGRGGVGIVRVSGPLCSHIAEQILKCNPTPRQAAYLPFHAADGQVLDQGVALSFIAPHSFTGEDVLELQGHGGPVVMDLLLKRCFELGARAARPGEFSQRAFLNDKLDLAQAEAIADLINSSTESAARSAMRSLQGEFSRRVHELLEGLIQLRVFVESAIDFPEEEIDFLADEALFRRLADLKARLASVRASARQGQLLNEGMRVVILGQPNAGKSSLLNQLAGRESAIVTDIAGTTRDVLREQIHLDGMPLHLVDTAGLREAADIVEQEGIRRAWQEVASADRVLLLVDDRQGISAEDEKILQQLPATLPYTLVRNKIDLAHNPPAMSEQEHHVEIRLSAKTGDGLDLLRQHLKGVMGFEGGGEGVFMARRRHLEALSACAEAVDRAEEQLEVFAAGELAAEELRQAQAALNEITGEFDNEALLDRIFTSFCIGK